MDKEKLLEWIRHPEQLDTDSLPELEAMTREYPAFAVGHILLARNLNNLSDERFPEALSKAAAVAGDRNVLLHFMHKNPPRPARRSFSKKADAIIEKFLREEPRITPRKDFKPAETDPAGHSLAENDDLITETLALLYLQQGNETRAIQIYQKLGLLFPEKSPYFAGQIEKIRNQRNSTT